MLLSFCGRAQHPSISFTPGLGTIAGETTGFLQNIQEYGFDWQLRVAYPLWSDRFNLIGETNYSNIPHQVAFTGGGSYLARSQQSFWGLGLRWYFFEEIANYRPYWGMFAPYIGLKYGRFSSVITEVSQNTTSFVVNPRPQIQLAPRLSLGISIGLSERWMLDANIHFTHDPLDGSDGLVGTSPFPDIWVNGGIGIAYDIGHWFEITRH